MSMFTHGRYTSNEWIVPIVEEARPILEEFPPIVATEVASAVLKNADTGCTDIPWVTVFPSDDESQVAARLLEVLKQPDYSTPAYDPDTHLAVEELQQLLLTYDADGMFGAHAAYHLVQAAAGKENETFLTFQDKARRWPQYSSTWTEDLRRQFGDNGCEEVLATNQELADLLEQTETVSALHYKNSESIRQQGESTNDLIVRALDFFDITSAEGLAEAARILSRGFEGYRKLAYQIRGLPAPTE